MAKKQQPPGGLGRHVEHDPADAEYPLRLAIAAETPPDRVARAPHHTWGFHHPALNQGAEGTCFPAGTLIRMATGEHRPIEDIHLLDEVVTAEGRTGRVLQTMVRFHGPGLVRLKLWGHRHLRMTPEHPVLTRRGYVAASSLVPGDYVALTRYTPEPREQIETGRWVSARDVRQSTAQGQMVHHGRSGIAVLTQVAALPATIRLTAGFGRLIGMFLAEGSASASKVIWTFGAEERETLVEETVALLRSELGIEARIQVRPNNAINVVAGGKHWAILFARMCGTGAAGKGLDASLASGPEPFLRAMFEGWLDGDGYKRRTSRQGVSVSHRLVMDMHAIAQSLGYRPCIRRSDPKPSHGVMRRRSRWDLEMGDSDADSYRSQQDDGAVWRKVAGLEFEEFVGPVYNLHVEGDNSYVAEGIGVHNCVGHGWQGFLIAVPRIKVDSESYPTALDIYRGACPMDGFADNDDGDPKAGTTVRAGATWLQKQGIISGDYRWAETADEVADWISGTTPHGRFFGSSVVVGINWYRGMDNPDADGLIRVSGRIRGGHCVVLIGCYNERGLFLGVNSWGSGWGQNGLFRLSGEDLDRLLREDGEACVATQKKLPKVSQITGQPATQRPDSGENEAPTSRPMPTAEDRKGGDPRVDRNA